MSYKKKISDIYWKYQKYRIFFDIFENITIFSNPGFNTLRPHVSAWCCCCPNVVTSCFNIHHKIFSESV